MAPSDSSAWTSSRWTLKFADQGKEQGFLRHNADRVARATFIGAFITLLPTLVSLVHMMVHTIISGVPSEEVDHILYWQTWFRRMVWFLTMVVLMVGLGIQSILQRMSFAQREVFVTASVTVLLVLLAVGDARYVAKLLGMDLSLFPCFSDAYFVLVLANVTVALHLTVPIRWHILVVHELVALFIFGGRIAGPLDPDYSYSVGLLQASLVLLTAIGKRRLDITERTMFSRLVAEQTLRSQAEFQLSLVSNQIRSSPDELQSVVSTTPSDEAFRQLEGNNQDQQLDTISMIGRREQWLVGEAELQLTDPIHFFGSGGFGAVVSGSFQGTPVAVKFPVTSDGAPSLAQIANELRILRKLKHPNIVMFHGACFDFENRDIALVLELLHGRLMTKYLGRQEPETDNSEQPTGADRTQCLIGVCCALRYLHSRTPGIVHGDIKPCNVIVEQHRHGSRAGTTSPVMVVNAKLLDFGLSRVRTRRMEPLGGSVRWAAPEVFSRREVPKPAADVYSFGCLVYFAACGEMPFATWRDVAVSAAKRRGHDCLLQLPSTLLLEHSLSMVEQTTCHRPEPRPTMEVIHGQLMQWPECHQTLTNSGISLARPVPPGREGVLTFWQEIRQLRQTLQSQQQSQQRSQQRNPSSQRLRPQLPPILEEQQQISGTPTRLSIQGFAETPLETMMISAISTGVRWNHRIQGSPCCKLHAMVHTLGVVQQMLLNRMCQPFEDDVQNWVQCPRCFVLDDPEEDYFCVLCGYVGSPLSRDSTGAVSSHDVPLRRVMQL